MELKNKNILLISPEPWEHLFVSKHHYAIHLAERGNKVFFLGPPKRINTFNPTGYHNVWLVEYKGFLRGLRFFPAWIQRNLILREFERIQLQTKTTFDIVWSFDNSVFYDFDALPKNVYSISHIVDWNQDFQFKRASETANICLAPSHYILSKQKKYCGNAYFINHGYAGVKGQDWTRFKFPGTASIKAFYAGNLAIAYIDWGLLETLVAENPKVDFCFAGSGENSSGFAKLKEYPNVYYLGNLAKPLLLMALECASILLLVYRWREFPEQLANPHKMMEYLASGKVVIATWTEEYSHLAQDGLIIMQRESVELENSFRKVVEYLESYNSSSLQQVRKLYAKENTYDKQIERIEALL